MSHDARRSIFSLQEAQDLLPEVKRLTNDAVRQAESIASQLQKVPQSDPRHEHLSEELTRTAAEWASSIQALGLEAKGLWLVDFDNGQGYYCWAHPEDAITHYHSYEDGFAGRMKIV